MPAPQIFDILVLLLVGWLTLRGAVRGMVTQLMSIASVVVSWIAAVKFSPVVAPMISDDPPGNRLVAMLVLFIAGFVAMWLISGLLNDIVKVIRLKSANRALGAVFGFTKGILLCLIITFFLVVFSENTRNFALESISGKYFARGIERISVLIPEDVNEVLSKRIERFQGLLEEKQDRAPNPLVSQVRETLSGVLSLKDIETQTTPVPVPSSLREKIASSPTIMDPPKPTETPPRQVVLPFQPGK